MYSKNVMARLFPALNDDDHEGQPASVAVTDRVDPVRTPTIQDLAPILSQFVQPNDGQNNGDGGGDPLSGIPLGGQYTDKLPPANGGTLGETGGIPESQRASLGLLRGDMPPTVTPGTPQSSSPTGKDGVTINDLMPDQPDEGRDNPADNSTASPEEQANVDPGAIKELSGIGKAAKRGKLYEPPAPEWQPDPNKSDRENARDKVEFIQRQKVIDHNHGLKGRIWEAVQNALEGISETYKHNPRASWQEEVAGGAGGAIGGAINKTWNEQRQHDIQLGDAEGEYKLLAGNDKIEAGLDDTQSKINQRADAEKLAGQKLVGTQYDQSVKRALAKVKFGYKKGANPALDKELERYGIDIDEYNPNKKTFWQGQNYMKIDVNGRAVPVKDDDGKPIVDPVRAPVTIDLGNGQKFTVPQTTGFTGMAAIKASEVAAENKTAEDQYKDTDKNAELSGKIEGARSTAKQAEDRIAEINAMADDDVNKIDAAKELPELRRAAREARSKQTEYETERKKRAKVPTTKSRRSGVVVPKSKDPEGLYISSKNQQKRNASRLHIQAR